MAENREIDLGNGFSLRYTSWSPDRKLNPQYDEIPDQPKMGAIMTCKHGKEGALLFDRGPQYAELWKGYPLWTVEQEEPLTLSPSVDSGCCHGYIRNGKWVDA